MKVNVIGKKQVHFTDDKGKQNDFYKVFVTHKNPISDDITQYDGAGCSEISLPLSIFSEMEIGADYLMEFDRKGKLLEVSEL